MRERFGWPWAAVVHEDVQVHVKIREWIGKEWGVMSFLHGDDLLGLARRLDPAPALYVLGVRTAGPCGVGLCRRLRATIGRVDTPVLFLAASPEEEREVRTPPLPGTVCLLEPLTRGRLLWKMRELLPDLAPPTARPRVLVVDDDPSVVALMRALLEEEGYKVEAAFNGRDGIEAALREEADVMLLDVQLPVMQGYEVCRYMKSRFGGRTKVLMVSSLGREADVGRGLAEGADGYLRKPAPPSEILEAVRRALG